MGWFDDAVDWAGDAASDVWEFIEEPYEAIGGFVGDTWDDLTGKTAAEDYQEGVAEAGEKSEEAGIQAREEVLAGYDEAYRDIVNSVNLASEALKAGEVDSIDILRNMGFDVSDIVTQGAQGSIGALLGTQDGFVRVPTGAPTEIPRDAFISDTGQVKLQGQAAIAGPGGLLIDPTTGQPLPTQEEFLSRGYRNVEIPEGAQYGLSGAEAALTGGLAESIIPMTVGSGLAVDRIGRAYDLGSQSIQDAVGRARGILSERLSAGRVEGDPTRALEEIQKGVEGGVGELSPFKSAGLTALQREMALSGALGAQAQQAAIDEFIETPGQQYLRSKQEQSLLRNASAMGGLQGGNVRTALQEQAYGIAAQQQQQQIENLRAISNMGLSAATNMGGFRTQGGIAGGGIVSDLEQAQMAQNAKLMGQELAEAATSQRAAAQIEAQTGIDLAELSMKTGLSQADLMNQLGYGVGGNILATAGTMGSLRAGTGADIANIIGGTAGAQADVASNVGANISNIAGQTAINQANLLRQTGQDLGTLGTGKGTTLGNISLGQGSTAANLALAGGEAKAAESLGLQNLFGQGIGLGSAMLMSGVNPLAGASSLFNNLGGVGTSNLGSGGYSPYSFTGTSHF